MEFEHQSEYDSEWTAVCQDVSQSWISASHGGQGNDLLPDFAAGTGGDDVIDLTNHGAVSDFAGVQAAVRQVGGGTIRSRSACSTTINPQGPPSTRKKKKNNA